jgi:hypothetical protein
MLRKRSAPIMSPSGSVDRPTNSDFMRDACQHLPTSAGTAPGELTQHQSRTVLAAGLVSQERVLRGEAPLGERAQRESLRVTEAAAPADGVLDMHEQIA